MSTAQVGAWDEAKVDSIVDLIISPDMLNMNIFRYNIGGGDDPSHLGRHMVKAIGKPFWQSETGPGGKSKTSFESNLGLTKKLFDDMRYMKPQAWLDWQLMYSFLKLH